MYYLYAINVHKCIQFASQRQWIMNTKKVLFGAKTPNVHTVRRAEFGHFGEKYKMHNCNQNHLRNLIIVVRNS